MQKSYLSSAATLITGAGFFVGVGVGVAVGVFVGFGVAVGSGVKSSVGSGSGVTVGVGVGVSVGVGLGVSAGVGLGVKVGEGLGLGLSVGVGLDVTESSVLSFGPDELLSSSLFPHETANTSSSTASKTMLFLIQTFFKILLQLFPELRQRFGNRFLKGRASGHENVHAGGGKFSDIFMGYSAVNLYFGIASGIL